MSIERHREMTNVQVAGQFDGRALRSSAGHYVSVLLMPIYIVSSMTKPP